MKPRKKRKRVRQRDWDAAHETAFTHDRAKHLKGEMLRDEDLERGFVPTTDAPNAVVVAHSGQWATVNLDGREQLCLVDEDLMETTSTLLAPGDRVLAEEEGGQHFVRGIAARRTTLCRLALERSRVQEQLIAVNVDLLVIVAAARKPRIKAGLIDRYLIMADRGGVTPILCVNKMDLAEREPDEIAQYRDLGLDVCCTSCHTGEGVEALRERLRGACSVFAGHSGVGKSSLLNALAPQLALDTREVSRATEKGKHTTTAARLYALEDGIRIIDTPGIRQLGLAGVSAEELDLYFPELEALTLACKFRDCTHTHEPGCAVRAAVEAGEIAQLRYRSYVRIRESLQ